MRTNKTILSAGLVVMLALLAGCQTKPKDERSAGRSLDDKNITTKVTDNLKNEPTFKFNGVHVSTFAGVVALSGFVNTDEQKERAEQVARNTVGVQSVANGITLKPTNVAPTGRTNTEARIYSEPQNPVMPSTNSITEPK